MRILVATDGSPGSDVVLDELLRRPWPAGSEVKIVSVADLSLTYDIEPWVAIPGYHDSLKKAIVDVAVAAVEAAVERIEREGEGRLAVSYELLHGSAKRAIVDAAAAWGADLILVGAAGRGRVDHLIIGSVSQSVAANAKCSVEIIRPSGGARSELPAT